MLLDILEGDQFLDEATRKDIREQLVVKLNKLIDIPLIGEAIEHTMISFLIKAIEVIGRKYGKKLIDDLLAKIYD